MDRSCCTTWRFPPCHSGKVVPISSTYPVPGPVVSTTGRVKLSPLEIREQAVEGADRRCRAADGVEGGMERVGGGKCSAAHREGGSGLPQWVRAQRGWSSREA